MSQPVKRWQIAPRITPQADQELIGFPPILRQILYNRGYATHDSARQYLEATRPAHTDANTLLGMPEAVERILWALRKNETIAIYGDYDVDGVTATALLGSYLKALEGHVIEYIPNRFDEGYGLHEEALDTLKAAGANLVITVDCGIRSLGEANHARKIGLDLIISDHHHPGSELPETLALIDPKQPKDPYPEKDLAGVGLAYKIVEALNPHFEEKHIHPKEFLDYVALGTIADLAPLIGENRYMVREGLKRIRQPQRQGLLSLIGVAGLSASQITATDIGFALGPRLNAAGRLDSALAALELLTTNDIDRSSYLAQILEIKNRERQRLTRELQTKAEEFALLEEPDALLLFTVHPDFSSGIVGLVASRLTERYYRPAIVGQIGEAFTRASCRSIPEFHITQALDQCADLLEYHGGHAAAAGFTVRNENLYELKDRLKMIAAEQLSELDLRPTISAEAEVYLSDLQHELLNQLDWIQPTGYGNPQPLFASLELKVVNSRTVGSDNAHLKFTVSDGWLTFDAIAFRQGDWIQKMPKRVDLIYTFETNEYRGQKAFQLNVRDLKPAGGNTP